jgi:xanthine dehydrogenase molybdopterin-binding subunit B
VPGVNDAGIKHDEPLFPDEVMYVGHAVCWVLGETLEAARRGAAAVEVDYDELPSLLTVEEAIAAESFQGMPPTWPAATSAAGLAAAAHVFEGVTDDGGAGALLPRDALLAGHRRRERPGLRAVQHPAPDRDPGDRRPRARRPEPSR